MGTLEEFKSFALKGNVVDMAVGIVVGAAFNKVVTSLVNDVIMPPIGYVINGVPFKDLRWVVKEAVKKDGAVIQPEVAIQYGLFINTILEFLIVAFSVFVMVKFMNRLLRFRPMQPLVSLGLMPTEPGAPPSAPPAAPANPSQPPPKAP